MMESKYRAVSVFTVVLTTALVLSACSSSGSNGDDNPSGILWDYGGGTLGPAAWVNLSVDFATCGSGQAQSPIDITVDPADDVGQFVFDYREEGLDLLNDGHTLIFNSDGVADIMLDGVDYDLKYFHFHVSSEHLLKGQEFEGEIHFYHESAAGNIAVVAVWVNSGGLNKAMAAILDNLPVSEGEARKDATVRIDPSDFLPADKKSYGYEGSLSEPPCTEGVYWIVMRDPIDLGLTQLGILRTFFGENVRPVQPLNGRPIIQK